MVTRVGVCRSFNKFDAVHQQILTCVVTGGFWDRSYVSRYHPREQWRPSRAWKSFCRNGLPRAVGWVSVSIDIVATVSFSLRSLSSFALCISLSGFASAASLIDAIDAARAYDAGYSAARNAQDAGHQKRWQGIAGLLPRAQFDASYTKQDQPSAAYAAAVRRHDYSASVTQPITISTDTWVIVIVKGTDGVSSPLFPMNPQDLKETGNASVDALTDSNGPLPWNLGENGVLSVAFSNPLFFDFGGDGICNNGAPCPFF